MAGLDIETAVRSEIPILTIILNNGVMTHYDHHMAYATKRWGSNKLGGDYATICKGMGAHAEKVSSPKQIGPAIQRALAANIEGKPAVIEAITKVEENTSRY